MNLKQLVLEQHLQEGNKLLESVCADLTVEQSRIVKGIYKECLPLIEASLTADQVNQIFTGVQQNSRTALGKAIDVPSKVNSIINQIGGWLQNTTPVKFADQQYTNLKNKVAAKFPNLDQQLTDMGTWMKENPGKSAAIIGVLTALASLAGGPVGGAIAGQVLKGASELIKGEQLSTAVGKGLKAAATGWLAGKSVEAVGGIISNITQYLNPEPIDALRQFYEVNVGNGLPNIFANAEIKGTEAQVNQFNQMWNNARKSWNSGNYEAARAAFRQAEEFAVKITQETMAAMGDDPNKTANTLKTLKTFFTGLSAAAQGAATAVVGNRPRPTTESEIRKLFVEIDKQTLILDEGIFDKIKQAGQRLTSKISADQLLKAWQAAGSPMDSDQIANFLQTQNVSPDVIKKVYQDSGLGAPVLDAKIDMQALITQIQSLTPSDQQKILASLV